MSADNAATGPASERPDSIDSGTRQFIARAIEPLVGDETTLA